MDKTPGLPLKVPSSRGTITFSIDLSETFRKPPENQPAFWNVAYIIHNFILRLIQSLFPSLRDQTQPMQIAELLYTKIMQKLEPETSKSLPQSILTAHHTVSEFQKLSSPESTIHTVTINHQSPFFQRLLQESKQIIASNCHHISIQIQPLKLNEGRQIQFIPILSDFVLRPDETISS
jgi:hypothetical protein